MSNDIKADSAYGNKNTVASSRHHHCLVAIFKLNECPLVFIAVHQYISPKSLLIIRPTNAVRKRR